MSRSKTSVKVTLNYKTLKLYPIGRCGLKYFSNKNILNTYTMTFEKKSNPLFHGQNDFENLNILFWWRFQTYVENYFCIQGHPCPWENRHLKYSYFLGKQKIYILLCFFCRFCFYWNSPWLDRSSSFCCSKTVKIN